jgi:hypothetical protein
MRKVKFKTLNGVSHELELDPKLPICEVKPIIRETLQLPSPFLRLILGQRELEDSCRIESLELSDSDFITVLSTSKPLHRMIKRAPAEPAQDPIPKPGLFDEILNERPEPEDPVAPTEPSSLPLPHFTPQNPSVPTFSITASMEEKVNQLMELGFSRPDCVNALMVLGGNMQLAIDSIMNTEVWEGPGDPDFASDADDNESNEEGTVLDPQEGSEEDSEEADPFANFAKEDLESIERLEQLGYDRETVIQVFVACDKDENVAANCLLAMP